MASALMEAKCKSKTTKCGSKKKCFHPVNMMILAVLNI